MNKYEVYITDNKTVTVEADDFSVDMQYGKLRFERDGEFIATFNWSNIIGFRLIEENNLIIPMATIKNNLNKAVAQLKEQYKKGEQK